jgi:hypothetical protein
MFAHNKSGIAYLLLHLFAKCARCTCLVGMLHCGTPPAASSHGGGSALQSYASMASACMAKCELSWKVLRLVLYGGMGQLRSLIVMGQLRYKLSHVRSKPGRLGVLVPPEQQLYGKGVLTCDGLHASAVCAVNVRVSGDFIWGHLNLERKFACAGMLGLHASAAVCAVLLGCFASVRVAEPGSKWVAGMSWCAQHRLCRVQPIIGPINGWPTVWHALIKGLGECWCAQRRLIWIVWVGLLCGM